MAPRQPSGPAGTPSPSPSPPPPLPLPAQVGAIVGSCKREPITVGKPAEFMLENIATQFNLKREQICMVGTWARAGLEATCCGAQYFGARHFGAHARRRALLHCGSCWRGGCQVWRGGAADRCCRRCCCRWATALTPTSCLARTAASPPAWCSQVGVQQPLQRPQQRRQQLSQQPPQQRPEAPAAAWRAQRRCCGCHGACTTAPRANGPARAVCSAPAHLLPPDPGGSAPAVRPFRRHHGGDAAEPGEPDPARLLHATAVRPADCQADRWRGGVRFCP
jgi:hypothetical protein